LATNIEQQWAESNLNKDLTQYNATNTTINNNEEVKPTSITDKIFGLDKARESKVNALSSKSKLDGYEDVTITGLNDADTVTLSDGRTVRLNDPLHRYDATEIEHKKDDSIFGKLKEAITFGKSNYAEDQQRRHASMLLGKQPNQVTDQDLIDVGNMQQVQMLSDLTRSAGQDRWEAPLVQGVGQADLTKGLDIKARLKTAVGGSDGSGRVLGSLVNPETGINVTSETAVDPRLNAFAPKALEYGYKTTATGEKVDTLNRDNYLGNLVDATQYGLGSAAARVGDAAGDLLSRTAKEVYKALPGDTTEEQASAAIGNALKGLGYDDKGNFTALDKYKTQDEYGYDSHRINEYVDKFKSVVGDPKASLFDKAKVTLEGVLHGPEVLASSSGDMLLGMTGIPGMALMAAGESNEILDKRAEAKGTKDLSTVDYGISLAAGVVYAAVNMLTKGNAGLADAKATIIEAAKHMDKDTLLEVGKKLTKDGAEEGLEEIFQGATEVVGEKLFTPKQNEILTKNTAIDLASQGALGMGGGVTGAVAGDLARSDVSGVVDKFNEVTGRDKEEPTTTTVTSPTKPEASSLKDTHSDDLLGQLHGKLADFDAKASRGESITKEDFDSARAIRDELAARKAAEVVSASVKGNSLGSISDIEKSITDYFTEKGISHADDMPMSEIVGDMITKHLDKEELADIQIALKNVKDVKDKVTWDKTIDDAIEARLSLENLTDSAAASRLGVMVEGIAPKEDRLGYTEYAKDALNGNRKSFDHMTRFIGVQNQKIDTLEAQHTELVDKVNAQIDGILEKTKGSVTRQDVVTAMAYAKAGDKALISTDEKTRLAPIADKVAKAIEATGANFWKTISVEGDTETKYSEEHYSRSDNVGKFKSRYFDVIPEIAAELGVKDINWNAGKEVSNVAKVMQYIKEEVADMDRLHRYIGETKFGIKPEESTTSTVQPESGTTVTPGDTGSTTVTPEEEVTITDVEETTVPEETTITTNDTFGGFDTGKTYTREEIEPFVRDMITNRVEDSDAKRKFYKSNKEVIDNIVKDVHKEKTTQKKTGDYIQDEILNVDLEALSDDAEGLAKLREIATKNVGTKDDEIRKLVDAKQKEAKELLTKRIDAIVNDGSISLSEALHTLDLMESIRETAKAEIEALEKNDVVVTDAANRIEDINKEIYEAMKAKDEYKALSKNYGELVNRYEKELANKTTEFNKLVTEGKKSIGDIAIDISDKNIQTKLGKLVNELIAELKVVQANIVDGIKKGIANIRRVTTILNKTKDNKLAVDKKIDELEAKIADLKSERKSLYSKPVKELIAERKELRREIADTRNETNIAKDIARGVQYAKAMLVTSKKGSVGSKAAAKGLKPVPMDISKIATVVNGKAASTLANAKLEEKIEAVDNMIARLKDNGIVPNSIGDTDLARFPYLMLLLDEKGNVNYNVAAAITTAIAGYITENKVSLTQLTPRDMESFFGIDENDTAGQAEVMHLGIPIKYVTNNIAKDISKLLGIKAKSPEMAEAYEKVMLGLAQAAIYSEMGTSLREEIAEYGDVGKVITVKLNDTAELGTIKDTAVALDDKFKVDLEKKTFRTEPRDIKPEDVKILRNDFTKPSEEQAKAIVKYTNLGWYPIKEVVEVLDGLDDATLSKLLGKKDSTGDLTKSMQESIRGKNLQIESDIEYMRDMVTAVKENKLDNGAAYFDWGIWKVGRNAIDSSGFNPQSIKLHRYMGTYKAQRGTVKPGDISETVFKLGVAQALKFKIDKEPIEKSMEYADKILTAKGLDRLERAIKAGKTKFVIGQETFKFEELSHAVMALTEGKKYVAANGRPFKSSMILESDGLTNGFAFKMLQYLVTKNDSFDLDQHLIEWLDKAGVSIGKDKVQAVVDRIKSGDIVDAYRTLGMNVPAKDGSEYMSITDTAIKGIDETVTTVVSKAIKQDEDKMPMVLGQKAILEKYGALTDLGKFNYAVNDTALNKVKLNVKLFLTTQDDLTDKDNKITDAARELMKNPFMTFGYGAGFKSIINSVTANIEDSMLNMLVKSEVSIEDKPKYDAMWVFAESIGFKKKDRELLKTKFAHEIKIGEDSNLHEEIKNFVTLTYGKRIEEVLTEEFKALTTVNKEIIQASTAMFHIWKTLYDKIAGVEDGKVPSKEVHKKALAETMSVFPVVASPLGKDVLKDGIPLVTQTRETGVENAYGNAAVKLDKDKFDKGSSVVQSIRETYKEIGVGAVVNMNQMIDGGTMTKVMNKFDIAQVFDALLLGVEQADAVSYINEVFGQFALDGKWSHIGAVSDRLNDILFSKELQDLLKKVGMDKDELLRTVHTTMTKDMTERAANNVPTVEAIANILTDRNHQNKVLRSKLKSKNIVFEQYVLDGKHTYVHKGFSKGSSVSETIDSYLSSKVDTKPEDSIINTEKNVTKNDELLNDMIECKNSGGF